MEMAWPTGTGLQVATGSWLCGFKYYYVKLEWAYLLTSRRKKIFQFFLILSDGAKVPAHRMVSTKLVGY